MRLSKRIAIGVMAAALALSMTACGGDVPEQPSNSGAGGTNTSTGSNTGTDTGDKKDDTTTTPPKDDSKEDDKNDEMQGETRTEKFFSGRYAINGPKWTYTAQIKTSSLDEGETYSGTETYTTDGRRVAVCTSWSNSDSVVLQDFQEKRMYVFSNTNPEQPVGIRAWEGDSTTNTYYGRLRYDVLYQGKRNIPSLREFANEYKVGTYRVDGVEYYSESYIHNYGDVEVTLIYCFDTGDIEGRNLRYFIELDRNSPNAEASYTYICKVLSASNTFDEKMLQVPEGREVYVIAGSGESIKQDELSPKDTYPN